MFKFLTKLSISSLVAFIAYELASFSLLCVNSPSDISVYLGAFVGLVVIVITPYTIVRIWRPANGSDSKTYWD